MSEATSSITTPPAIPAIGTRAVTYCLKTVGYYLGSLPFGLRKDLIYLWATFRLRHRPAKMLVMIAALGVVAAAWDWGGHAWISPRIAPILNPIRHDLTRRVLERTSWAIFSSLNILSCVSIFIMSRTLRRLIKQGHLESLLLTPRRLRPSALFYAIATRYLPLGFVAIVVIYVDDNAGRNPFQSPPFLATGPQPMPGDMWPIYWAGFRELSVLFFCPANLFMDLSISFFVFTRWRVSGLSTVAAVVVIGLVTPVILMYINDVVILYIRDAVRAREGVFESIAETLRPGSPIYYNSVHNIGYGVHYFATGALSVLIGLACLGNLDSRWFKTLQSPKKDPVLIRRAD